MTHPLRIVQVGEVAHVAQAIEQPLAPFAEVVNLALRQVRQRAVAS